MRHFKALKDSRFLWAFSLQQDRHRVSVIIPFTNTKQCFMETMSGRMLVSTKTLSRKPMTFSITLSFCLHKDCVWKRVPESVSLKTTSCKCWNTKAVFHQRKDALLSLSSGNINFLFHHCAFSPLHYRCADRKQTLPLCVWDKPRKSLLLVCTENTDAVYWAVFLL